MSESSSWKPVIVVALIVGGVWWWNSQPDTKAGGAVPQSASCEQTFSTALQQVRTGQTAGSINERMDWLSSNCKPEYNVITGYAQAKAAIERSGSESCDTWEQRVGATAADFLRADRLCRSDPTQPDSGPPDRMIAWDSAREHVGEVRQVCGPLASIRGSDDDVFLNIGRDYPDGARFTIVLWDVGGVESLPSGTEVCATGLIGQYQGAAEIELNDVSAVKVRAD